MIFVTVGAQMPFDRLIRTVDRWAGDRSVHDVVAQIGDAEWTPRHLRWMRTLDPADFRRLVLDADAVVTHAGMGTILNAMELGTPTLVLPRRAERRETRNDHQLGTARAFALARRVTVAWNEDELYDALDRIERIPPPPRVGSHASRRLLETLRQFIRNGPSVAAPA